MIIKPLKFMRYQDRLWKERELRNELQHEDRSWRNQQEMREIHRRRTQVQLERLNQKSQ
jgi:hypothetical protein